MTTAGIALIALALLLLVPSTVQRVRRHRARQRIVAASLAHFDSLLTEAHATNVSLLDDLKGRDELLNAYRAANGVLVRFITERHGPEVAATLPNPDAEPMWFAVEPELQALDEQTWGRA